MSLNNSKEFGKEAVSFIREQLKQRDTTWQKLRGDDVAAMLQSFYEAFTAGPELPFEDENADPFAELGGTSRARKKSPDRNPLFDALALSTGCRSLSEITKTQARAIGVALSEIVRVTPNVTPEEIERRALCYKRAHRDWALTASSLAKNWSEFSIDPETAKQKLDPYKVPPNWQERFMLAFPGIEPPAAWGEISVPLRADILKKTP
jgi:hypothetical protein